MKALTSWIKIGDLVFENVAEVEIQSGMDNLTDSCTVRLPRKASWKKQDVELGGGKFFRRGDPIQVKLGYDGNQKKCFEGFVRKVHTGTPVVLDCEDAMCILKEQTIGPLNADHLSAGLVTLFSQLASRNMAVKAAPIVLGKFRHSKTTFAAFLARLKREYGLYSYIREGALYCGPAFWGALQSKHRFLFQHNIISDSLVFQKADEIKLRLDVTTLTEDNQSMHFSLGDKDGKLIDLKLKDAGVKDLLELSKEVLIDGKYDGYTGSFTTFGEPFVQHGDVVRIEDKRFPEREGDYLVRAVNRKFGSNGYRQIIHLGRRADFKLNLDVPEVLEDMIFTQVSDQLVKEGVQFVNQLIG